MTNFEKTVLEKLNEVIELLKKEEIVKVNIPDNLNLLKEGLVIPATCGCEYIYGNTNVFNGYIDSDFKNWGLNVKSDTTEEIKVSVYEAIKDFTFKQIFTIPEKQVMTQAQIIRFCEKHPTWLRQEGYATFFLTKVGDEYFVVNVSVYSDGLGVSVRRLGFDGVWYGEYRHRVVSPQL